MEQLAKCPTCGQEFVRLNPRHRFCRPECRTKDYQQWVERTCEHCGKVFRKHPYDLAQPAIGAKYCSRQCFYDAQRGTPKQHHKPPQERRCPACGKVFTVGGRTNRPRDQIYCSRPCRDRTVYHHSSVAHTLAQPDAIYLAGFLDGEGSVMLYWRNTGVFPKVQCTNTSRSVLDWMAECTGVGKVHLHKQGQGAHRTTWQWVVNAEGAESVLRQILPYLKIKQQQAALAIETQQRLRDPAFKADRTWQAEYRERMRALNKRGPQEDQ